MNADTNVTTVSIPKPLANRIKKQIEGTGFHSVSSYVTFVLRQLLMVSEGNEISKHDAFDKKLESQVRENLKKLGYLD
ncbi:MAG: CopG family transcriptional regulator [Candidatus Diapherotrites archaeon]